MIAVVGSHRAQAIAHFGLVVGESAECGECGIDHIAVRAAVVGGARERRVHYHYVKRIVGEFGDDLGCGLFAYAAGAPRGVVGVE